MSKLSGIELKRAQLVPSAVFTSPTAVVHSEALSLAQKIAILRRWEFDVRPSPGSARTTAIDENKLLKEVRSALATLGASSPSLAKSTDPAFAKRTEPARH